MHNEAIIKKLENYFSNFPSTNFKKGQILIRAGSNPKGVYYIEEGVVKEDWISDNGKEVLLNLYKPASFIPMSWVLNDSNNNHSFEALTDVVVKISPKQKFLSFIEEEPGILMDLLKRVFSGIDGLWLHFEFLASGNSYLKMISLIVTLAKRFGQKEEKDIVISLKISERNISDYAGVSRETASRMLNKLKRQGLVTFEKGIIYVHDLNELENILDA